jgi:hypothetical protein
MIYTLTHFEGYPVLFDAETQMYHRFAEIKDTCDMNGKEYPFKYVLSQFLESELSVCIIPVFCAEKKRQGKRDKVLFITGLNSVWFLSAEHTGEKWEQNKIDGIEPKNAYFVYIKKDINFENGCQILWAKKIEKK